MEDKFGYLMKSEAEDHMREILSAHKKSYLVSNMEGVCKFFDEALLIEEQTNMTWGGRHSSDTKVYKVRNAQE